MKSIRIVLVAAIALLVTSSAFAHRVYFEPQAKADKPWQSPASDDFSFENPMVLDNIWGSKALFGYLTEGDVDVYKFVMPPFTPWTGDTFMKHMLITMPLTPGCNQTKNHYVNIALVGPGLPAATRELPFELPAGYGVVVKENPEVAGGEERPIFDETTANIAWFLPQGMTQQCIETNVNTCDMSNIVAQPVMTPYAPFYIVVWDDGGNKQDYTLSVGVLDSGYYVQTADEHLTYNNAHLHTPCTEPYPGN